MARNYDNYGYDDEKDSYRTSLIRRVLVIIMMLVAIILIIYLLSSCGKGRKTEVTPSTNNNTNTNTNTNTNNNKELFNYEDELIIAGKEYYQRHSSELPNSLGDCSVVELGTLLNENLIDPVKFGSCNIDTTYLKVCLLKNGERQYITKLTCVNKKSY